MARKKRQYDDYEKNVYGKLNRPEQSSYEDLEHESSAQLFESLVDSYVRLDVMRKILGVVGLVCPKEFLAASPLQNDLN